jgi:hypothetical protein
MCKVLSYEIQYCSSRNIEEFNFFELQVTFILLQFFTFMKKVFVAATLMRKECYATKIVRVCRRRLSSASARLSHPTSSAVF